MDLNRRFSDNEACWLVKVDTRVLGPFSFNDVVTKLSQGEFKPFHETSSPLDRWRPLQSHPLFSAAIERLKKQSQVDDQTFTRTERTSFTRTLDLSAERLTPTPLDQTITPPPQLTPKPGMTSPITAYNPYAPMARNQVQKKNSLPLIIAMVVVVLGVAALLVLPNKKSETISGKNQFLEFVDKGLAYKKNADWFEALRFFKKAYQLNNKDVDLVFEMAPLLIQVENQTMYARNMMEKIMPGQYKKENLSLGKNVLGLSYSYENQYKVALKYFDDLLKEDETYYPGLMNKGYALLLNGRYSEAETSFGEALKGQNGALPYLYLIENYILDGVKNRNKTAFEKAFQVASQTYNKSFDGQQELAMFQAFAALRLGKDQNTVENFLQKSLEIDPDQTSDHLHTPLVDWRGLQWSQFAFICTEMSKSVKPELHSFLDFVCTYKTGNELAAQQSVTGWMSRSQNSPGPHIAQAIVSYRLGEYDKAKVSLALAKDLGAHNKLYYVTLVKVCGRLKDVACLRKNYDVVAKMSPIHAFTAKAIEGKLTGGDNKQAVYSGLRESSNYIPLIHLQ